MSDEILAAFASESAELFEEIEEAVRDLEAGAEGAIDRLFRHVHTLKGSAAIVGLGRLEALAHAWESRLGAMRRGGEVPGREVAGALLALRGRAMAALAEGEPAIGADRPAATGERLGDEDEEALAALDEALARKAAPGAAAPAGRQAGPAKSRDRAAAYARVPSVKLEAVLSLASDVVVALSNLEREARQADRSSLVDALAGVQGLAASLYAAALDTRMVRFGDVAGRFRQAVEEIARDRGLRISFELSGADTEIDKGLADRLVELILHLVRNAADHGIEPSEARLAAGKAPEGRVTLGARREAGLLSIRVEDDGRGIDAEAVRARAVEMGLVAADARPDAEELMGFLFEPGFTLTAEVTKWSGRGVGLDAVKRAASALRGTARIESRPGRGSAAIVRLPLALSLVEGFTARVGSLNLLVPFEAASSCVEIEDFRPAVGAFRVVEIQGSLMPAVDLGELYGEGRAPGRRIAIVLDDGEGRTALIADEVAETIKAAVRPLDRNLADSPGIAGHATLGDGSMVLVLDCAELGRLAARGARREPPR